MTVVSLFTGIGGLERGLARAGYRTTLMAEIDPCARKVIRDRFPDVRLAGDVSELRALPRRAKILTAGFPCQNLSMAGDKFGIKGDQSSLVDEMFRLLATYRVPTVIVENVYFMLHLKHGEGISHLVSGFEKLGYRWAYRVVDTRAFGLPQRRRRVFMVASTEIDPRAVLLAEDAGDVPNGRLAVTRRPVGFYWTEGRSGVGLTDDALPPIKGGSGLGIASPPAALWPDGIVRTPGILEAERLQGFPMGWTRAANGSRAPRWRLIGNSVSVPVAHWIGRRLKSDDHYYDTNDIPLVANSKWPNAAWGLAGQRWTANVSEQPLNKGNPSLARFASRDWHPLSHRAAKGFLGRAQASSLNFATGFLDRIESYVRRAAREETV
jgi:DNA (cytosine-5)-methyltransferase 1